MEIIDGILWILFFPYASQIGLGWQGEVNQLCSFFQVLKSEQSSEEFVDGHGDSLPLSESSLFLHFDVTVRAKRNRKHLEHNH